MSYIDVSISLIMVSFFFNKSLIETNNGIKVINKSLIETNNGIKGINKGLNETNNGL